MSNNAVVVHEEPRNLSVFRNENAFVAAQRMCRLLNSSTIVPMDYRGDGNLGNAMIALDIANRMEMSPIMVMQNLHVIEGRPSWSSSFIISCLNSSGLFSPLRFEVKDLGEKEVEATRWVGPKGQRRLENFKLKIHDKSYRACAVEKATGEVLEGPEVSITTAVKEGWYTKNGSKWPSMPDLMGRYRAAAFFGRIYAPHILNGLQTQEEVRDMIPEAHEVIVESNSVEEVSEEKVKGRPKGVAAALKAAKEKHHQKEGQPAAEEVKQAQSDQVIEAVAARAVEKKAEIEAKKAAAKSEEKTEAASVPDDSVAPEHGHAGNEDENEGDDIFSAPDDDYNPE